jgi:UDP-N-acetylmuramate dehydrogenase
VDVEYTSGRPPCAPGGKTLSRAQGGAEIARPQHLLSPQLREEIRAQLERACGGRVALDEPMARHTTFHVGGPADFFVRARHAGAIVAAIRVAEQFGLPWLVLGGGANVLVGDRGIRGVVIKNEARGWWRRDDGLVVCAAGENLVKLARDMAAQGLSGMEWAVSVPGTLGGAVVGNAGAHGGCIADVLVDVELFEHGRAASLPAAALELGYRTSRLKRAAAPAAVLSAALRLSADDPERIRRRMHEFAAYRAATQPKEASVGCIFKNPPEEPAGRLIDRLGLKGTRCGNVMISPVHANFFVNTGSASARDVLNLIEQTQAAVRRLAGIELEPEILLIGEW